MPPPLRISTWPYVVVRIDCRLCPRKGCYRLARLAVRYGPDMDMDRLLAHRASDCRWWRARPRNYDPCCGARLTDFDRAALPDLPAELETSVLRQRIPPRESVPQRRVTRSIAPPSSPAMLSACSEPTLVVVCRKCGRREEREVAALLAQSDAPLVDLRAKFLTDCPQRMAFALQDRCNTFYEGPDGPGP